MFRHNGIIHMQWLFMPSSFKRFDMHHHFNGWLTSCCRPLTIGFLKAWIIVDWGGVGDIEGNCKYPWCVQLTLCSQSFTDLGFTAIHQSHTANVAMQSPCPSICPTLVLLDATSYNHLKLIWPFICNATCCQAGPCKADNFNIVRFLKSVIY